MRNRHHTNKSKKKISLSMKTKDLSYLHTKENIEKRVKTFKKNGKLKGKTRSEDVKRKISLANSGENHGMFGKTVFNCPNFKCPILCIETGQIFGSQAEAAKKLKLFQANINKVLKNERSHTGGYSFIELKGD